MSNQESKAYYKNLQDHNVNDEEEPLLPKAEKKSMFWVFYA